MSHSLTRTSTLVPLIAVAMTVGFLSCIKPVPDQSVGAQASSSAAEDEATTVWDGEQHGGNAKEWASCNLKEGCKSAVKVTPSSGVDDSVGLEWHVEGKDWKGFGWNWHGFWPVNAGTDLTAYKNLSFMVRLKADDPNKAPSIKDLTVGINSSSKGSKQESATVSLMSYIDSLSDGKWHEVIVPLTDLVNGKGKDFDLAKAWEFRMGEYAMNDRNFTVYVDKIGFDSRKIISMISLPEKRNPAPVGADAIDVTAKLDIKAAGAPVSPYIFGVSHGAADVLQEMGVTMRRQGGNTSSPYDWRTGFSSTGADWFFENTKVFETPHPQENWWVMMHRENLKYGMKSFMTMPSEWLAKDSTSVGFPKDLYPNCEAYAPDRPEACNGKLKDKDKEGKTIEVHCGEHPPQAGKKVDLEYNVDLVKYCIKDAGFGRADQGGINIIALDNEPMLYRSTHRDLFCNGFTNDDYWARTKKYAELIRQADPSVKIAAPSLWGWTAYSYSSGDTEYLEKHGIGWDKAETLPDFKKYGPFARDFMRRCAEYKKKTGHDLVDVFSFHGYPMTPKLDFGNQAAFVHPTPELQEFRVRDVRKFWDETYRDPDTWMGKEKWSNGNVAYVPLMKRWMKEAGWSAPIAIGEYDHAGPDGGFEISSAVAQAETFAAFARAGVTYAFYWVDPRKHGPAYFAFKMFRNPDGKHTAVGDQLVIGDVSDFDSVSVYAFKDAKTNVTSLLIHNKRAQKGARVAIDLGAAVPSQKAPRYEYSNANPKAIGELPPLEVSGKTMNVSIAPMSILRIDVKM